MQDDSKIFTEEELERIEKEHPDGMNVQIVLDLFKGKKVNLSEATFRKYVQLGLLPRSRRIGRKGRHKGSQGMYPSNTVRRINEIKWMMQRGVTIEQLMEEYYLLGGEIEELQQIVRRIISKLSESSTQKGEPDRLWNKEIDEIKDQADRFLQHIQRLAKKVSTRARVTKTAI